MTVALVTRAAWGARYAAGFGNRALPAAEAWLHHAAVAPPADNPADEARTMRQVESIGQQRFGAGFSYNVAVAPSGRIYEGCGEGRIGAHTAKRNTRALGVVLLGNYELAAPPDAMVDALVDYLRDAARRGVIDRPAFDGGHRDLTSTACPGRYAYALLGQVNSRAAGSAAPTREDDDMTPEEHTLLRQLHEALPLLREAHAWAGETHAKVIDLQRAVPAAVRAAVADLDADVDEDALAAALLRRLGVGA